MIPVRGNTVGWGQACDSAWTRGTCPDIFGGIAPDGAPGTADYCARAPAESVEPNATT